MLLLAETNDDVNVIRVITGPESDVTTGIYGAISLNITDLLAELDKAKPIFLSIVRVPCETELIAKSNMFNMKPPFVANMLMMAMSKEDKKVEENKQPTAKKSDLSVKPGKCLHCNTVVTDLMCIEGMPSICPTCYKIAVGSAEKKKTSKK